MIDLHTHSLLSDGALLPSELVRRAEVKGYRAMAITDHVDVSNIDFVVPRLAETCNKLSRMKIQVIPGAEITHVPKENIGALVAKARGLGALLVLVHGETLVEPVESGTNRAGILAGADILAHPGLITQEDGELAEQHGVLLELTSRRGHSLSNGHVVRIAESVGARLVLNTDAHEPSDLMSPEEALGIAKGAGLSDGDIKKVQKVTEDLLTKML